MKKRLFRLGALCCVAAMTITTSAQALSVEEAYDILQRSYVDKLPRAAQDAKSLDELFSYTDDYTYYMTAEEYQAFLQGVEGDVSFAGIGAEITYVPEGIRIVSVLKGGGAEKAGLAAGDIIIAIDIDFMVITINGSVVRAVIPIIFAILIDIIDIIGIITIITILISQ